jgi:MraZ protein
MGAKMSEEMATEVSLGFTGNYPLKLDSALRVAIPAKFKDVLEKQYGEESSQVVLIPDLAKIKVLPLPVWRRLQGKLNGLSDFDPNSEDYRTFIFGNMALCSLDAQNRVKLTPGLCGLAELEKEAVFVGRQDMMEIWSADKWREFTKATASNFRNVMAEVFRNSRSVS